MKKSTVKTSIEILFQINFSWLSPLSDSDEFRHFILETPITEYELTLYKNNPEMFVKSIPRITIDYIAGYFEVDKSYILNLKIVGYNINYYLESENYPKTVIIRKYDSYTFS